MRWSRRGREAVPSPEWLRAAEKTGLALAHLDTEARDRLIDLAWRFDSKWSWEGVGGLDLTPDMRGHVSTLGSLLVLSIDPGLLNDISAIIVGPAAQNRTANFRVSETIVTSDEVGVLGEARLHGPIRLAWDRVLAEKAPGAKRSVVLHEFAHKIDMVDGVAGGTPPIARRADATAFEQVMAETMETVRTVDDPTPLRRYAATNGAELFAVASETFFLNGPELRRRYRSLYEALRQFYRQDPAKSRRRPT